MTARWATTRNEKKHWQNFSTLVAGVDEAGRGALAGPIVAAAVILPAGHRLRVADSKLLSAQQRERLFVSITKSSLSWSVALIDAEQIDRDGIDRANELVVRAAVARLSLTPDHVFADAVRLSEIPVRWETVIDGDALISSVAAASIIAKVARDQLLYQYDHQFPVWNFKAHKGYGTAAHFAAIRANGLSPIHRRSFVSP